MRPLPSSLLINRLQVQAPGFEPLVAQLRTASALSAVESLPAWGPSAIVCIRRLRDPKPKSLRLQAGGPAPGGAWVESVQAEIAKLARRAVRPIRDPVPATAEAVVFMDQAELLTCLVSDWLNGKVGTHWWWQSLLRYEERVSTPLPALQQVPAYVPAVMQQLAEKRLATAFAASLSARDASELLRAVFAAHGLPASLLTEPSPNATDEKPTAGNVGVAFLPRSDLDSPESGFGSDRPHMAPWSHAVPETMSARLEPEQEALLGIGVLLQREPALVRTTPFDRAFRQWYQMARTRHFQGQVTHRALDRPADKGAAFVADNRHEVTTPSVTDRPGAQPEEPPALPPFMAGSKLLPEPSSQPTSGIDNSQTLPPHDAPDETCSIGEKATLSSSEATVSDTVIVETELGGLFYLINLGLFLGLYGDFTTPAWPGIDLPIWDFIALIGRALLGDVASADPVWPLLDRLAGRQPSDEPVRTETSEENPWLGLLLPTVRARLRSALAIAEDQEWANLLLRRAARVFVTSSHLDVVFSLNDLPIEIRLSGLDRNPGWVPVAGRFVRFHYH